VVSTDNHVLHHKSSANRLPKHLSYYRRILALHYFMTNSTRFSAFNRLYLLWSLIGNALYQLVKRQKDMLKATLQAIATIGTGRNPYLKAQRRGKSGPISPTV
jgi:hypothetical protein